MKQGLTILILFLFSISCSEDSEKIVAEECTEMKGCTFDLRTLSVRIEDEFGNPFILDEYYIIKLSTGKEIKTNFMANLSLQQKHGSYPLLSDSNMKDTNKAGQEFRFTGKRNGKVVVRESYIIGHDCCHIVLKKGEQKIVLAK